MEKGNIIFIYEDPLTKKKREGDAKLLKKLIDHKGITQNRSMEYWKVQFISDNFICNRWIKK